MIRRIVANFFISLDGVVEVPHEWHFPYYSDEMGQTVVAGAATAEVFLFGRCGYDDWAGVWPHRDPADPFTAFINTVEKVVLTTRPGDVPEWNNTTVASGDFVDRIRLLMAAGDGAGSATTVRWLLDQDLLDELNLLLHPLAVGRGQRLFDDNGTAKLALQSSTNLPNGVGAPALPAGRGSACLIVDGRNACAAGHEG